MPDSETTTIDTALKLMAQDGELSIRINGNCMEPMINDGALVSIHKQAFYWPGDVVVKRCLGGQLVAHRLIGVFPRKGRLYFVSRADSAKKADVPVVSSRIIGRVSGGECNKSAVSVPLRHRIKATGQFVLLVVKRLGYRLQKLFPK